MTDKTLQPLQHVIRLLAGCAFAMMANAVSAAPIWNFSSGCSQNAPNNGNYGNSYACSSAPGAPVATVSAWSTTGNGATTFQTANAVIYSGSGFGVRNRSESLSAGSPNHSLDNAGTTDLLLFNFGVDVILDQLGIGWKQTDADISVLRYAGPSAPTIGGLTIAGLLGNQWELVGNYANTGTGSAISINPADKRASWWMISAYNSGYGGTGLNLNNGNDYFKLSSLSADVPAKVPEPGSLPLMLAAMAGLYGIRRIGRNRPKE